MKVEFMLNSLTGNTTLHLERICDKGGLYKVTVIVNSLTILIGVIVKFQKEYTLN